MYILQEVIDTQFTFVPYEFASDMLEEIRTNKGLSPSEFDEFMLKGSFERPGHTVCWFEGEVPVGEQALAMRAAFSSKK